MDVFNKLLPYVAEPPATAGAEVPGRVHALVEGLIFDGLRLIEAARA